MNKAEWMSGKYGVMVHYLPQTGGRNGEKKLSPNEMAEGFDVKAFADEVEKMGAGWLIFPFGQNSGYYWSENPYIEEKMPGICAKRDLILDIANEVTSRGIRFMAYIPTEFDFQSEAMRKAFAWNESPGKEKFMETWMKVITYYAEKLGDKLSGWWYDGNYNSWEKSFANTKDWSNARFDREKWFAASKAGNKDAVIAMCTGANLMGYVFEEEEYLPGEANDLTNYPWDYESRDKQWHVLTWLDCFWMNLAGEIMPEPKFSNKELYSYVKKCLDKKGALTLNIGIFEDGTLPEKTVEQVCGLKKVIGNNSYQLFSNRYDDGIRKFALHMKGMKEGEAPVDLIQCEDGNYYNYEYSKNMYDMQSWTASFVTGLAPLYYKNTKDENYIKWANSFKKHYHAKMFETPMESMHDLGFLYSPYSVGMYNITGDMAHREDAIKAADELAKRFNIKGGYIEAWERMDDDDREGRAIIDCMMNISLLLWAWKETGHTFYRDVAVSHAEVTKKYFVREDFSVAHSFLFDRKTGDIICEDNKCGYENGSWWARGTAWAVYGYAILSHYLNDNRYSELAENIAKAYISELSAESTVPVWDFRLPSDMPAKKCGKTPADWDETAPENCKLNTDASAAAIMASALLDLYNITGKEWMKDFAIKSLTELSNDFEYWQPDRPGFIGRQNGMNVFTSFGDYFYIEALTKVLYNSKGCWIEG